MNSNSVSKLQDNFLLLLELKGDFEHVAKTKDVRKGLMYRFLKKAES